MSKYIRSLFSFASSCSLSLGTFFCFALPAAQASHGLMPPTVIFQPIALAVFLAISSFTCPSLSCISVIDNLAPQSAPAPATSVTALFMYMAYNRPFGVGILMSNVIVLSFIVNTIASSSPLNFHPFFIIFVKLNKLYLPVGNKVTSCMVALAISTPCLSHMTPLISAILTAFSLIPLPIVIASDFSASRKLVIPSMCGVLWTVAAVSAIHTFGSINIA